MKKTIMAVAVTLAAVWAQAASIDWSVDNVYVAGTEDSIESGYYAYFFAESVSIPQTPQSDLLARSSVIQDIKDGKISFLDDALSMQEIGYGYAADSGVGDFAAGSATDNEVSGYLVIMSGDKKYAYVTDATSCFIDSGEGCGAGCAFGDLTDTQLASNWMSVGGSTPTPEPTSGLLILVGMAGLALRRRRA